MRLSTTSFLVAAIPLMLATMPAQAQEATAGERLFVKCKSCHQVGPDAKSTTGPQLNGLFGRQAGSVTGFKYSPAMQRAGFTWDDAAFAEFLRNPRAKVPGTKMMAGNVQNEAQVADLAAYLKQFGPDGGKAQ